MKGKLQDDLFIPNEKGEIVYVVAGFSSTSLNEDIIERFRDPNNFNVKIQIN